MKTKVAAWVMAGVLLGGAGIAAANEGDLLTGHDPVLGETVEEVTDEVAEEPAAEPEADADVDELDGEDGNHGSVVSEAAHDKTEGNHGCKNHGQYVRIVAQGGVPGVGCEAAEEPAAETPEVGDDTDDTDGAEDDTAAATATENPGKGQAKKTAKGAKANRGRR